MKKRYRGTAVLLAGVMLLAGCSSQNVPESSQAAQETSAEPEITPEQEKLGRIQPSAYNNVNGLNLEPAPIFLSWEGQRAGPTGTRCRPAWIRQSRISIRHWDMRAATG